jgi:hypothetical protein
MRLVIKPHKRIISTAAFGLLCLIFLPKALIVRENIKASPVIVIPYSGYGSKKMDLPIL